MMQEPAERLPSATTADNDPIQSIASPTSSGMAVLQAWLGQGLVPGPAQVASLIDRYPGERNAMFALLQRTLGNRYVTDVLDAMASLRLNLPDMGVPPTADNLFQPTPIKTDTSEVDEVRKVVAAAERGAQFDNTHNLAEQAASANQPLNIKQPVTADPSKAEVNTTAGMSQGLPVGSRTATEKLVDGQITASDALTRNALGATDTLKYGVSDGTNTVTASGAVAPGAILGGLDVAHKASGWSLDASAQRVEDSSGNVGTALSLGGTAKLSKEDTVNASLAQTFASSGNQTEFKAEEDHTGKLMATTAADLGFGKSNYDKFTEQVAGEVHPDLYASVIAAYNRTAGKPTTESLGGSMIFTLEQWDALSLAGAVNQDGEFEIRAGYEVFKNKVNSIASLAKEQNNGLLFWASYASSGTPSMLNSPSFGGPPSISVKKWSFGVTLTLGNQK